MNIHESNIEISKIDWTPLFRWVNTVLNLSIQFEMDFENKRPMLVCPNLVEHCGIFGMVVKDVRVDFFNFFREEGGNFSGSISIQYESWGGGSNGMNLGNFWYNSEIKGWTFETKKEMSLAYAQLVAANKQ